MPSLHPLHPKSGWEMQCRAAAAAKIPLTLRWGGHPLCAEGNPCSSGASSPSPPDGKSVSVGPVVVAVAGGGERELWCPQGCEGGELPADVVGFSSVPGGMRDRGAPSCALGVLCTPGAREAFCFVSLVAASLGLAPRCPCVCLALSGASPCLSQPG